MAIVDSLEIQIAAESSKASASLNNLIGKLDRLDTSLTKASGAGMASLATGVNRLVTAMNSMKAINAADFTRLAKNMEKIAAVDNGKIRAVAVSFAGLTKSLGGLSAVGVSDSAAKIGALAKGIAQLGYKSSTQAIKNIPLLATAMEDLIRRMSALPTVSNNLIKFTTALAKLARTGGASGTAAKSLTKSMTGYSSGITRATKHTFSFASALGKIYATYWLIFRAFSKLGDAINLSSSLTEVQNVVDVTFGKYADMVERMSETSIQDFGMSELTVKQVSSRFQAMGMAMGFAQDRMASMSVELTKLTADMASFYNLEQEDVAEDLQSIFTGQTRPLRQYGLDLTEATLKEWAMKQGIDANISAMSQAEKTMLRYQYVLANTGAAQGDFLRTADTWANQTRMLKQNLEQLGIVIGTTFINAFKPLVSTLNVVIGKFTEFAIAVSNSLGKIFGWTYEDSKGGGLVSDYEDAANASDDLASGTGKAADNAKKLKTYLLGIDELNVLSPDKDNAGGGSGGSGGGVSGGAAVDASGGQWVQTESIIKKYESELDSLEDLGSYISTKLANALNKVDWNSVYQNARNFGTGLAEFLNGLIGPGVFGSVGRTVANSLNTSIQSFLAFEEEFDFRDFGYSLAYGFSQFLITFDFKSALKATGAKFDGFVKALTGFVDGLEWDEIFENIENGFEEFLEDHDWKTTFKNLWDLLVASAESYSEFNMGSVEFLLDLIITDVPLSGDNIEMPEITFPIEDIKTKLSDAWEEAIKWWKAKTKLGQIVATTENFAEKVSLAWDDVVEFWKDKDVLAEIKTTYEDFKKKVQTKWNEALTYWNVREKLSEVQATYEEFKDKVREKWNNVITYWSTKTDLSEVKAKYESFKDKVSEKWNEVLRWWEKNVKLPEFKLDFKFSTNSIKAALNTIIDWINVHIIDTLNKISITVPKIQIGNVRLFDEKTFGFDINRIPKFKDGGFPEPASLFWAGENGIPEMLGTVGGRTAVASGAEITGIKDAVYSSAEREIALLREQNELLRQLINKEPVKIGDREIAKASNRGNQILGRQLIVST